MDASSASGAFAAPPRLDGTGCATGGVPGAMPGLASCNRGDAASPFDSVAGEGAVRSSALSVRGTIRAAVVECQSRGLPVAGVVVTSLHPSPRNLESVLKRYRRIVVAELNAGQLATA